MLPISFLKAKMHSFRMKGTRLFRLLIHVSTSSQINFFKVLAFQLILRRWNGEIDCQMANSSKRGNEAVICFSMIRLSKADDRGCIIYLWMVEAKKI